MKIAIFGGTFDPIHSAHLTVAREALTQLGLDKVLFVPAGNPPHKTASTAASFEDRYQMVALACQSEKRFLPSRLEEGEGKSFSILTIEKLRSQSAPADRLFFLIGADAFAEIESWRRWRDVVAAVEFVVVTRPGHDYAVPEGATVHRLETVALPVSSSDIRGQLQSGKSVTELPDSVTSFIRERGLYR